MHGSLTALFLHPCSGGSGADGRRATGEHRGVGNDVGGDFGDGGQAGEAEEILRRAGSRSNTEIGPAPAKAQRRKQESLFDGPSESDAILSILIDSLTGLLTDVNRLAYMLVMH